jgi:hypothetical protein
VKTLNEAREGATNNTNPEKAAKMDLTRRLGADTTEELESILDSISVFLYQLRCKYVRLYAYRET